MTKGSQSDTLMCLYTCVLSGSFRKKSKYIIYKLFVFMLVDISINVQLFILTVGLVSE